MDERTQAILEAVIQEFIGNGEPVSSEQIYRKYRFDVKPATIRNELHALSEDAFLEQPHTSGGRVPTDKAYRFFVERVFEGFGGDIPESRSQMSAFRGALEEGSIHNFVTEVSDVLRAVGVGYGEEGNVVKSGLDELIDELIEHHELSDMHDVAAIVHDIEMLDERMENMLNFVGHGKPCVFIGKSPITKSPHLSVIADSFEVQGRPFLFAAVGSKRMNYVENIRLFLRLKNHA
jgi:transcriptional regulator of heat shock response